MTKQTGRHGCLEGRPAHSAHMMRMFDRLPQELRDAINYSRREVCVICVRNLWRREGHLINPVAAIERQIEAREQEGSPS